MTKVKKDLIKTVAEKEKLGPPKIRIKVYNENDLPTMDIREIHNLQGDLKEFKSEESEKKYLGLVRKRGLRYPFRVWKDNNGKNWMLGGNGLKKIMLKYDMRNQEMTFEFPVLFVYAKNKNEAAEMILEESSKFHKETTGGLMEFTDTFKIGSDHLNNFTSMGDFTGNFWNADENGNYAEAGMGNLADHAMGEAERKKKEELEYSRKIVAPTYSPQGEKPTLEMLFDNEKTNLLIAKIEKAKIPEEEKEFLKLAAQRHTVFNYQRIADYYAHSPKKIQRLFEESALVIIDFKQAIEGGYVVLSDAIAKQFTEDYNNEE